MSDFKEAEDFSNPLEWDSYSLAVFAHTLNPRVSIEYAQEAAMGFFAVLLSMDSEPTADMFVELAHEMIAGQSHSIRTH
jgi:hypothetical protein